jgi:UDPglucose 6-dehydrogenase
MKITVIGSGYVGLVTGACLADVGNDVLCLDVSEEKIKALKEGKVPIFEPGLDRIIARNVLAGRLQFSTDVQMGARHGLVQVIAVGTPPGEDGAADLSYVLKAAKSIAEHRNEYAVIVDKSTVPIGTGDAVERAIHETFNSRGCTSKFSVVSNPEFLKEGAAIEDFTKPDRIVVGIDNDPKAESIMRELYAPFQRNHEKLIFMSRRSAELTKYAANAMLATRISFMNEMASVAEATGANIEDVRRGIGSDPRIGYSFLYAGTGYGGSCFPKDVKAVIQIGRQLGLGMDIMRSVEQVNERQKTVLFSKIMKRFSSVKGKVFALWGLAFKPNTDDMREAPSIELCRALLNEGAIVQAYDPVASSHVYQYMAEHSNFHIKTSAVDVLDKASALLIVTEWTEFRSFDLEMLKVKLEVPIVFDGRNLYDAQKMRTLGIEYHSIGREFTGLISSNS